MKQIKRTPVDKTKKSFIKPKRMDTLCKLGGIIKCNYGYGFKVVFKGTDQIEKAQHYKDMFKWIIESDKIKVNSKKGYFDRKE